MAVYDSKSVGQRIAHLRDKLGLTQDELAEHIDVSGKHIGRIERGESNPSPSTYVKLSQFFKVSMDYLFFGYTENITPALLEKTSKQNSSQKQELMMKILTLLDEYPE